MVRKVFSAVLILLGCFAWSFGQSLNLELISPPIHESVAATDPPIHIRFSSPIDTSRLQNKIIVTSTFSASKRYAYVYNEQTNTVSIATRNPFFVGEKVNVIVTDRVRGAGGELFEGFQWSFSIISAEDYPLVYTTGKNYFESGKVSLLTADINKDEKPDVVVDDKVWLNDGNMGFTLFQTLPLSPNATIITDTDLDYNMELNGRSVLEMEDGQFVPQDTLSYAFVDFNNDGFADHIEIGSRFIGVHYNQGNGLINEVADTLILGDEIENFVVADFNNDGILDIAHGSQYLQISFFNAAGQAEGAFVLQTDSLPDGFGYMFDMNAADFNNDRFIDLHVVTNAEDFIFLNDQNGVLLTDAEDLIRTGGGDLPHGAIPADLNGDGWTDLISYYNVIPENYINFYVLPNPADPSVTFWSYQTAVLLAESESGVVEDFAAADFNGDGVLDIVALWSYQLHIYFNDFANALTGEETLPQTFEVSTSYPNPFNNATTISFTLNRSMPVDAAIFDISGRQVLSFGEKMYGAGQQQLSWDGRDGLGAAVSSGLYFWKFSSPAGQRIAKVLLLK